MAAPENPPPDAERQYHRYVGNVIPWYVRLIWIGFWILCIFYILRWLFPAIQVEVASPP
jgi:hypothetical protein